jgi:Ca2+-binding RTX toxin-like protein
VNDHDWFAISLTAGQSITVFLDGITLVDPYLRIRDGTGTVIFENDDITAGTNRDSSVSFTASYSGVYYIDVAAWVPPPDSPDYPGYTGTYQISVTNYTPPPLATNDEIATQLVETYWGGDDHHFNATQGGTITVNLTALTPAGQNLARNALALWSDVIGVNFLEVANGGQIEFDDADDGAYSTGIWGGGITTSAQVNVSTQWLTDYGTGLTSYAFQAYIHEIGHALGLGHAGNYNDTARFPFDASFQNDSWATSIMSYFDQQENTYFAGQGFTIERVVTPMVADIIAMSRLYGLSTTTRTGDTTYGFNNNSGRSIYDANQYPNVAYTIFDSGGIDTLDYSGFTGNQVINLNPEVFGNFGNGNVGNLVIARGVVIENAFGGSGSDTLTGNFANNVLAGNGGVDVIIGAGGDDTLSGGANNDMLTGGSGNDTFQDTTFNISGDTITDFSSGDRIIFTNASFGSFSFSLAGNTLTFSGGSLTLTGGFAGGLVASAAAGGGVQITAVQPTAARLLGDFNGDGRDDVLLRHDNGLVMDLLGQTNGSFLNNYGNAGFLDGSWHLLATGDFNGDLRDDVLFRNANGTIMDWLGQTNGTFTNNYANAGWLNSSWHIAGTGDFNNDGMDDLLLRNDNGLVMSWLGQANGGFTNNYANAAYLDSTWSFLGTGDFNGDGRSDILWQNNNGLFMDWLGQANGGFTNNYAQAAWMNSSWHFAGTGDFNGDGRDDVLWRNDSGLFMNWLGQLNGGFANNYVNAGYLDNGWLLLGTGDFNGDNKTDLVWQNDSGLIMNSFGQLNGSFVSNYAVAGWLNSSWHLQGIGDVNGDGRDDLLLRNDDGTMMDWLGEIAGNFTNNYANAAWLNNSWHIQPTDSLF